MREREREMQSVCRAGVDASNSIKNRCFKTYDFETCESIIIVRRQNHNSYMNRFLRAPLVFSKAAQHGLALFVACSRGRGLSGSVTYRTREVARCSPLPVVFVGIKLTEF